MKLWPDKESGPAAAVLAATAVENSLAGLYFCFPWELDLVNLKVSARRREKSPECIYS